MISVSSLENKQHAILNPLITLFFIAAIALLPLSWLRVIEIGFHPVMLLHTFIAVMIVLLQWQKQRLSLAVKTHALVAVLVLIGFGTIFKVGDIFFTNSFFILAVLVASITYSLRYLIGLTIFQSAVLFWFLYPLSNNFVDSLVTVIGVPVFTLIIIYVMHSMLQRFSESEADLREQNRVLEQQRDQLESERQRFAEMLAMSHDGTVLIDVHNRSCQLSAYAQGLFTEKSDQEDWFDFEEFMLMVHFDDRHLFLQHYEQFVELQENHQQFECRFISLNSETLWLQLDLFALKSNGVGEQSYILLAFKNITEAMRISSQLNIKTQQLDSVFQNIAVGVVLSRQRRIEWVNQRFCDIVGYSQQELIGQPTAFLMPKNNYQQRVEEVYQKLLQGESVSEEGQFETKDGQDVWVRVSTKLVTPNSPDLALLALVEDVTDRKQAELKLKESEQVLSQVVEASKEGVWSGVRQGDEWHSTISKIFYQILEVPYDADKIWLVEEHAALILPEDLPKVIEVISAAIASGETYQLEYRIKTPAGRVKWLLESGVYTDFDSVGPTRTSGSIRDITEQKNLQLQLELERNRLHTLMELASDGIHTLDGNGRLVSANVAFLQMLGYDKQALEQGIYVSDFDALLSSDLIVQTLENLKNEQEVLVFDTQHRHQNGTLIDVQVSMQYIDINGEGLYYASARNISERKAYERKLLEAKEVAELAANEKSSFLAKMSHEIRTPLNAVIGFLDFLDESLLDEVQKKYTHNALLASNHLLEILTDILDYSRLNSDKFTLQIEPFHLHSVVEQVENLLALSAQQKRLELLIEYDPELPKVVLGDVTRLTQIIANLLSNGIKYTEAGQVKLSLSCINQSTEQLSVLVEVSDTGIGIAPHLYDAILDPFTQVDNTHSRSIDGVGLGLNISLLLLKMMGSELQFESKLNQGSRFYFTLQMEVASQEKLLLMEQGRKQTASYRFPTLKALIAEDNELNREMIKVMFERLQIEFEMVENGRLLYEACLSHSQEFDFLLVDIQMPIMNGTEAVAMIRSLEGYEDLPIIAATANVTEEDRQAALQAGMNDILIKPYTASALIALLLGYGFLAQRQQESSPVSREDQTQVVVSEEIQWINVERALEYLEGNRSQYQKICGLFVDLYPALVEELIQQFAQQDMTGLGRVLHRIQGSAATIGAEPLQQSLQHIQALIKSDDGIDAETLNLHKQELLEAMKRTYEAAKDLQF